jgi:hypothetical protein
MALNLTLHFFDGRDAAVAGCGAEAFIFFV